MYKSVFNLPCACSLMRNGNNVPFGNFKGRGKRIHLYAFFEQDSETPSTKKHPYLQIEPSSASDSLFRCGLYQVLKFNQTLISEGKITIEIVEGEEQLNLQVSDISLKKSLTQKKMAYLILSDSTPQSLAILVKKVHDLILSFANKSKAPPTQQNPQQPKEVKQVQQQQKSPFQTEKPKVSLNKPNNNMNLFKNEKSSSQKEIKVELNSDSKKAESSSKIEQSKQVIVKLDQEEGSTEELDRKGSDEIQVAPQKQLHQKIQGKLDFSKQTKQKKPISIINVDSQQSQEEQTLKGIDVSKEIIDAPQTQEKLNKFETEKQDKEEQKTSSRVELQIRNLNFETALKPKQEKQQNHDIIQIDTQEQSGEISSYVSPKQADLSCSLSKSNEMILETCEKENTQNIVKDFEKNSKKVHFGNNSIHKKDNSNKSDSQKGLADSNEQSTENAKYFLQKEGTESQYEREQRTMSTETEKSQVINAVKFSSLQSKIEEIKGKKKKEGLLKQQQEEKSKQLYKVDRSLLRNQSPLQAMKDAKNAGIKRRNPFSCESDSGGIIKHDVDEEGKLNDDVNQNSSEEEQLQYKSNAHQVQKSLSQSKSSRLEFKETTDLEEKPVKKLGSRFLFQKNSFNLQKTPAAVDLSTPQSKVFEESSASKKGKNIENTAQSYGKELLLSIPEFVMGNILEFLEKHELFQVRTVSKFFNSAVFFSIRRLEFSKPSTPNERVIDMLSKAKYLQAVKFGRLAHVTPSDLLDHWVSKISTTLLTFDCSAYTQLTEKLLVGLLKASPNIMTLIVPFFGKITDNSLVLLSTLSKKLTHFKLESSTETFQRNEKISDAALARVVAENYCLVSFSVFTISPMFFEKLKALEQDKQRMYSQREAKMSQNELGNASLRRNQDAFARIQTLKIHNLVLTRNAEDNINQREEQLNHLKDFSRLKELKIRNVLRKAKGDWFLPYSPQLSIITEIFSSISNLGSLCVGEWCTNEILGRISENLSSLKKIRIIGSAVNDSGLEMIFQKMDTLEKVNIVDATRINGHCFESVISRNLSQIKVKFDDYRLNCLQSTITDHLQLPETTILNFKQ